MRWPSRTAHDRGTTADIMEETLHRHHTPRHACPDRGEPRHVAITVMGDFSVSVDGVTSPAPEWSRRTASTLIKILALAPGHRLHRERVMDLLWPDDSPAQSAPRLHKAAHFARRAAGHQDAIVLRDDQVWLFPGAEISVDALHFEELARSAVGNDDPAAAHRALEWYGGELLPDDRYEDWAFDRRELLHLRRLDVLRVANEWRELAEVEPADEEAHVQLMRRHIDAGDRAAALRQCRHFERVLERDLGVEPGAVARQMCLEASLLGKAPSPPVASSRVEVLLAEMAELVSRQTAVLAELANVGATPPSPVL